MKQHQTSSSTPLVQGLPLIERHVEGTSFEALRYRSVIGPVQEANGKELANTVARDLQERGLLDADLVALDIGAGEGTVTKHLASTLGGRSTILAIDPSLEMLAAADADSDAQLNVFFIQASAEEIDSKITQHIEESALDIAFTNFAFHWVFIKGTAQKALENIRDALADDGVFYACFSPDGTFEELFLAADEVARQEPWNSVFRNPDGSQFTHPHLPDHEQFKRAVQAAGFVFDSEDLVPEDPRRTVISGLTFEKREILRTFPDEFAITNWFYTCIRPFMDRVDPFGNESAFEFARQVIEKYKEMFPQMFDTGFPQLKDVTTFFKVIKASEHCAGAS